MAKKSLYEILGISNDSDYYKVLGVSEEATEDEIEHEYYGIYYDLNEKKSKGEITEEEYEEATSLLDQCYETLSDAEARETYDDDLKKAKDKGSKKKRGTKVTDVEDEPAEEEAKKPSKKAKKILQFLGVTALVAAIIIGAKSCASNKSDSNTSNLGSAVTSVEETQEESETPSETEEEEEETQEETEEVTEEETQEETVEETPAPYGDISDDELVTERATELISQLDDAGCNINLATGLPYSVDEVKNIILYINGAYVPTDEDDVYNMYTEWANFMCILGNTEDTIYQVNYRGGETSFADIIAENAKTPINIDLTTAATYGTGYGEVYVRWLQGEYFKMLYTTSEEEYEAIWAEVWQSYADIMKGNGYTVYDDKQEVLITEQSLLLKDNIGIANQINAWLLNFEVFRTNNTKDNFTVINKYVSAEDNEDVVTFDEMAAYINAACDSTILDGVDYAVDDEGNSLYTATVENAITTDDEGYTWGMLTQMNTKGIAYERLAAAKANTK